MAAGQNMLETMVGGAGLAHSQLCPNPLALSAIVRPMSKGLQSVGGTVALLSVMYFLVARKQDWVIWPGELGVAVSSCLLVIYFWKLSRTG
jgi:hypothetical protein